MAHGSSKPLRAPFIDALLAAAPNSGWVQHLSFVVETGRMWQAVLLLQLFVCGVATPCVCTTSPSVFFSLLSMSGLS